MVTGIGIGTTNPIHMLNATNAFKAAQSALKPQLSGQPEQEATTLSGIDLTDNNFLLKSQNIDEIKEFAKIGGEENISNDDIKYGLTYGRSVIADYLV